MIVRQYPNCRSRKDRDSNPRSNVTRSPHFECGPFDHSGIFPDAKVVIYLTAHLFGANIFLSGTLVYIIYAVAF